MSDFTKWVMDQIKPKEESKLMNLLTIMAQQQGNTAMQPTSYAVPPKAPPSTPENVAASIEQPAPIKLSKNFPYKKGQQ